MYMYAHIRAAHGFIHLIKMWNRHNIRQSDWPQSGLVNLSKLNVMVFRVGGVKGCWGVESWGNLNENCL